MKSLEQIDGATSRSICEGIGERLRQNLQPDRSELPPRLQHLMHALLRQED